MPDTAQGWSLRGASAGCAVTSMLQYFSLTYWTTRALSVDRADT